MFNATFNTISVISKPSVLLEEETEVPTFVVILLVLSDPTLHTNRISSVIVRVFALNAVDREFESRSCQDSLNRDNDVRFVLYQNALLNLFEF
jgi:hypothetical protein